jgi:hypothetical protein
LHQLAEELSDDEASAALLLLQDQLADASGPAPVPEFFGMLHAPALHWDRQVHPGRRDA